VVRQADYIDRSLYYCAHNLSSQLESGKSYGDLHQVICISILDFDLFPADDQPHHKAQMVDRATGKPLSDKMNMHFLELHKAEKCGNITKELAAWVRFFAHAHEEDYMESAVPAIGKAHSFYLELLHNTKLVGAAADRERAHRDFVSWNINKERTEKKFAETEKRFAETEQRFAETEQKFAEKEKVFVEKAKELAEGEKELTTIRTQLEQKQAALEQEQATLEQEQAELQQEQTQLKKKEEALIAQERAISEHGKREQALETAKKMLARGCTPNFIAECTELTIATIKNLQK
jgi:DNA repair exonuclease SbcCD ATPase subunit